MTPASTCMSMGSPPLQSAHVEFICIQTHAERAYAISTPAERACKHSKTPLHFIAFEDLNMETPHDALTET